MTKDAASFLEKMAGKDSKRKKKKDTKTTEAGVARRLAKQGRFENAKANSKAARKYQLSSKMKKWKNLKEGPSSSSSYSDSSSSSTSDSSSNVDDSSSDDKKEPSKQKKPKKGDDDNPAPKAKSKAC